jgi:hypothetical protein
MNKRCAVKDLVVMVVEILRAAPSD